MTAPISENTQAILLLTAPLIIGRQSGAAPELLSPREYNRLARLLRDEKSQPSDLLGPDASSLLEKCRAAVSPERVATLLARGFLLGQAVDHWRSRSIWVVSRADTQYPRRLKTVMREDAPVILYGCGDSTLLNTGGLAVVGSRNTDTDTLEQAENAGRLAAVAGIGLVSGGARGVDQAAMRGAFQANGIVLGVLSDSLARAALAAENRDALRQGRAVLVSAQDPSAGFNVGFAMQRNKYIYALSDAAFVVNSDYQKGGTWAGAIEQLERYKYVPVFVRERTKNGESTGKGNEALLKRGALRWPAPDNAAQLVEAMTKAAEPHVGVHSQQNQDELPIQPDISERVAMSSTQPEFALTLEESPAPYAVKLPTSAKNKISKNKDVVSATPISAGSPAHTLLECVEYLLKTVLVSPKTEAEIAECLAITKSQTKAWLKILVGKGSVVKTKKPIRYQTPVK